MRYWYVLLLLVGCAHPATYSVINLPNGAPGVVLTCHYRSECYRLATRGCNGATYMVVEAEDITPHVPDADTPSTGNLVPATDFNPQDRGTEFVVQCNAHMGNGS